MSHAIQAQLDIKAKCEQMQQYLKEQYEWEQEMKQKEALARERQADGDNRSPPIRSCIKEMDKFLRDQTTTEKHQKYESQSKIDPAKPTLKEQVTTKNQQKQESQKKIDPHKPTVEDKTTTEKQHNRESQKNTDAGKQLQQNDDFMEAERLNGMGNEFYKRAKEIEDPMVFKERCGSFAISMYTKAIELNGKKAEYFLNRALCYFKMEQFEDCIADCDAAIGVDKSFVKAYLCRMQAFEYIGNNVRAYQEGKHLLTIATDSKELYRINQDTARIEKRMRQEGDAHKGEGNTYLNNKNYLKAQECFTKAINSFPFEAIYYHNRSMTFFHLKDYENCLADTNKAIQLDKTYHRPYYQRMRLREIDGDYVGAISDCKQFIALVKDDKSRSTADKNLAKLNNLLAQKDKPCTYNWNELRKNAAVINFVQKPPHLRSKRPLKRIQISETSSESSDSSSQVVASNYEPIPEAVIDKIFNNNTGERLVEPKQDVNIEQLFSSPSSASNRLRNFYSPLNSPSSPPADLSCLVSPIETEKSVPEAAPLPEKSPLKLEKDKMNQENYPTEFQTAMPKTTRGSDNPFPSIPSTTVQFYHTWNRLQSQQEKFIFLKSLENSSLHNLLGATMSNAMLTDILQVLEKNCFENNYSPLKILSELGKCQRMEILLQMMSDNDKYSIIKLFEILDVMEKDNAEALTVKKGLII